MLFSIILFSVNVSAKNYIKRIDPELANKKSIAMALETYDGEFYDISQFKGLTRYKGNIRRIMRKGLVKLKTGDEIDINAIRYFFVQSKVKAARPKGERFRVPSDEE